MQEIVVREYQGFAVQQRKADRYIDATALCKASGRDWHDYWRLQATQEFISALADSTGIPGESLVESKTGRLGGTWVHPDLALHLAQWCSPRLAVQVCQWVRELLTTGSVTLQASPWEWMRNQIDLMEAQERQIRYAQQLAHTAQDTAVDAKQTANQARTLATAAVDIHTANYGHYTVLGWCRRNDYACDISTASAHGRRLSKICSDRNVATGQMSDPRFGTVKTYPENVLAEYFEERAVAV